FSDFMDFCGLCLFLPEDKKCCTCSQKHRDKEWECSRDSCIRNIIFIEINFLKGEVCRDKDGIDDMDHAIGRLKVRGRDFGFVDHRVSGKVECHFLSIHGIGFKSICQVS